jgi:hypothetical protein
MALLAEQLVDEWLNRQGFFTVRGIKEGVDEIDLLGVRPSKEKTHALEAWHVEVQVSFNPNAYISKLNKDHMKELGVTNRNSAKARDADLLNRTVSDWVDGKFKKKRKVQMREARWAGLEWKFFLVHAIAKYPFELELIAQHGIEILPLQKVLSDLEATQGEMRGYSGTDILEIITYYDQQKAR